MATTSTRRLQVRVGFATETGRRAENQDYVGACVPTGGPLAQHGIVAAVADGVGGHKGGRVAAETMVRAFIEAFYAMPRTLGAPAAAGRAIESVNGWIFAQGRTDPALERMSTTFSALVLDRRNAHLVHIGDSRIYRLSEGRLEQLTIDHVAGRGDLKHVLSRAIGAEEFVRFDHSVVALNQRDRFLLCSDGVHGSLDDRRLRDLLARDAGSDDLSRSLVDAALAAGSSDNVTALVLDVLDVPAAEAEELQPQIASLPILPLPKQDETIDGFRLDAMLSDGRYSRLFRATDTRNDRAVVLKFPSPRVAEENTFRLAFLRETWVASRMRSPGVGEVIELSPDRQTRLYSVMPWYEGETLEKRLARSPAVSLVEGVAIATQLARAITALHRARIIHRDIKPDNVILLKDGGLRLIDLGVARVPELEEFPSQDNPGTPSYMAPELFDGAPGDEATDLYALGVTVYRMFTGRYPYGEVEPFQRPKFRRYMPLSQARPDLPAWLDEPVARALAVKPAERQGDVLEFAYDLESGANWTVPGAQRKPLYQRNPLIFWQALCAMLAVACAVLIAKR